METGHMRSQKLAPLSLAIGLAAASTAAVAGPQGFTSARSFAMGSTGVAVAHPATANTANPAMLAARHHDWADDFGLILPSVNARFADEEEVVDQIDDIQDTIDRFDALIDTLDPANEAEARQAAGLLRDQLAKFDRDTVRVDASAGLSLAIPSPRLAVGVFANGSVRGTVRGELAEGDLALLDDLANDVIPVEGVNLDDQLESRGRILASAVIEAGVSMARSFDFGLENPVQLGISPKYVQLRTYNYSAGINDFDDDDFDGSDYETTKSGFNVDIGAAYAFGDQRQWNAGLAVRNLIPMELDSVESQEGIYTFKLEPQVTAGVAHTGNFHVVTAELDLTKKRAFGFEDDTQWLAVGAEFDAWRFAQLRLGARQNLASNSDNSGIEEKTQFTAGIGLAPFGARLDLAVLVSDADLGGAVEFGVSF